MLQCSGVALCKVGHPRLGHLNKARDSSRLNPLPLLRPGSQGAHRHGTPCVRHVRGRGVCEDNRRGLTGCEYAATVSAPSDSDRLPMLTSHCSELLNLSSSDG
jgi:hypothetical protein